MHNDELTWDELFILQATLIAQKSKDPSTKVGCVIVNDDNVIICHNDRVKPVSKDSVDHLVVALAKRGWLAVDLVIGIMGAND